jgi:hypothetical protein
MQRRSLEGTRSGCSQGGRVSQKGKDGMRTSLPDHFPLKNHCGCEDCHSRGCGSHCNRWIPGFPPKNRYHCQDTCCHGRGRKPSYASKR